MIKRASATLLAFILASTPACRNGGTSGEQAPQLDLPTLSIAILALETTANDLEQLYVQTDPDKATRYQVIAGALGVAGRSINEAAIGGTPLDALDALDLALSVLPAVSDDPRMAALVITSRNMLTLARAIAARQGGAGQAGAEHSAGPGAPNQAEAGTDSPAPGR